jgi:glycosyltransferase involved in cell wall biosynthesis
MVSQRLYPYIAGAEIQALGLARALAAAGARVRMVTTRLTPELPGREVVDGVDVRRLPVASTPLSNGTARLAAYAVKAAQIAAMSGYVAARAGRYDVVHAHCLSASSMGAAVGARAAGVPIIVKPSLGGREGELAKILASRAAPALMSILRRVDRFAVMSPSIADELERAGVAPERFVEVANGVDLVRFCPPSADERAAARAALGLADGPVALFAGQLVARKGVRPLLEAWSAVREAVPDATLVFAGHGAEADAVEREAEAPGARIRFLGARGDVVAVMRAADALVLPSRNESFGNVVAEALACGLPVVVGRTGVAEALEIDGVAGRFVDPANPASIASALVDVLGSPSRAAELGARGRDLARRFDFRVVAERYLAIYENMLADGRGTGRG